MAQQTTIDEVLAFWFGELDADGMMSEAAFSRWWRKDAELDAEMRRRFGDAVEAAAAGELDGWASTPRGAVALIVLLDQFSRNIYRDSPRAFAQDERARQVARGLIERGQLDDLVDAHRYLALMPWMHSEELADHETGARLWQAAADAAGTERARKLFLAGLDFEQRHAVIVERFGRYPHRNAILGRQSTPEELAFLEQPGSSF